MMSPGYPPIARSRTPTTRQLRLPRRPSGCATTSFGAAQRARCCWRMEHVIDGHEVRRARTTFERRWSGPLRRLLSPEPAPKPAPGWHDGHRYGAVRNCWNVVVRPGRFELSPFGFVGPGMGSFDDALQDILFSIAA